MPKTKKKLSKQTAVCVMCGAEKKVSTHSILPNGWVFSYPDKSGIVEPICDYCNSLEGLTSRKIVCE